MDASIDRVSTTVASVLFPLVAKRPRPGILNPVIRAAVLLDLALEGALTDVGGGLEVDTTPTGFVPADRLLHAVVSEPDRSLGWWLFHAPVTVQDIAEVLIAEQRWDRHGPLRRYREVSPERRAVELTRMQAAVRARRATPVVAATMALIEVLPAPGRQSAHFGEDGLLMCRKAAWILPDLLATLTHRQAILAAAGRDAQTAQSATFMI